jgi:hypothetical protein
MAPLFLRTMRLPVLALALALGSAACSTAYIPNTTVDDTSENRKIIQFCEQYRHAVEDKNIGLLLKLASPSYFEDGGNTNAEDDIDYDGLKDYLTSQFLKTTGIRYEIKYRHVQTTEKNQIYVDYTYSASYKMPGAKGDEWHHTVADNRLVLVPDGESFKILAGM